MCWQSLFNKYIAGEHRSIVGHCIGVILQGVFVDDGELLDAFHHESSEFSGEYAILLGDLDLDLDLSLA